MKCAEFSLKEPASGGRGGNDYW